MITTTTTASEILACYPTMRELRPHLTESAFLNAVEEQQCCGYQLAYLRHHDEVVAVAGFRLSSNLAWGRHLYVDDLVTRSDCRSRGYGKQLLDWIRDHAREQGCGQLHLDSGVQRVEAHRFYEREGMTRASFHFAERL